MAGSRSPRLLIALALVGCSRTSLLDLDSSAISDDWPMYGLDSHHTFARTDSPINKANVGQMKLAWTFPTSDAVTASPTVVNGVVYVGAWDGYFYALDAASGAVKWKLELDCQPPIIPIPAQCLPDGQAEPMRVGTEGGMVTSSAAVVGGRVYFGGGKTLYCLDAASGSVVWKAVLCGNPEASDCASDPNDPTQIFSSPVLWDGKVLVGHTVNGANGYRGRVEALDARTGASVWAFEVDPILDGSGNVIGANNRGCGSIWSSMAIDEDSGLVLFGTGDCQADATPPYHEAILAIDGASGAYRWSYRPRMTDTCDFDFGATANVFDLDGTRYVGVGGKDATYYVLRSRDGQLTWSHKVLFGGASGGFIGTAAFDGSRIYGATGLGELGGPACDPSNPTDTQLQDPSYHVFDARTGKLVWEISKAYAFAASTVANGVVFNGVGAPLPPELRAYDADTGKQLAAFPTDGGVYSGTTLYGKMLFFGSGNSFDG